MKQMALTHPELFEKQQFLDNEAARSLGSRNNHRAAIAPFTLPVVVHIIHQGATGNISDAQVLQGIQHLNEAYSNTGYYNQVTGVNTQVQFCLAKRSPEGTPTTGINRVESPLTSMNMNTQDLQLKNLIRWDPLHYINIWLVNEIQGGVAGYAYLPAAHGTDLDGIVMEAAYFGSTAANSSVQIHEMGHYLGLYHTFQNGCTNNDCLNDGDKVCDTPPDNTTVPVPCDLTINSCSTDTNSGFSSDQNDMFWNYMDYGNLECYSAFTQGQTDRMHFFIENVRYSLLESKACQDPCLSPIIAGLNTGSTNVTTGTMVSFSNQSTGATNYQWYINGTLFSTAFSPSYFFDTPGTFTILLQAYNNDPNCSAEDSLVINVSCNTQALFNSGNLYPAPGETVAFTNASSNATSFQWSVNDTPLSNDQNFNYTFNQAGDYTICLEAEGEYCQDQFCQLVFVSEGVENDSCENQFVYILGNKMVDEKGYAIVEIPEGDLIIGGKKGDNSLLARFSKDGLLIWSREIDFSPTPDFIWNLFVDNEGMLLGTALDSHDGPNNCTIFKYNYLSNQIIWSKKIIATYNTRPNGALQNPQNGNYIFYGKIDDGGIFDTYVFEVDKNTGNVIWQSRYDFGGNTDMILSHVLHNDKIYFPSVIRLGSSLSDIRAAIIKADLEGNFIWSKMYLTSPNSNSRLYNSSMLIQNDTIVSCGRGDFFSADPEKYKAFLLKTDLNGNLYWAKRYNIFGGNTIWPRKIHEIPDGYIVQGSFETNFQSDAFVMRLDKQGNVVWAKKVGSNEDDVFPSSVFANNSLFFIGRTFGFDDFFYADCFLGRLPIEANQFDTSCDLIEDIIVYEESLVTPYEGLYSPDELAISYNWENNPGQFVTTDLNQNSPPNCECYESCPNGAPLHQVPDAFISEPSYACLGDSLSISFQLCNQDSFPIPAGTPITIYDNDPTLFSAEIIGQIESGSPVLPNECMFLETTITSFGTGTVYIVANDDGSISPPFNLDGDFPSTDLQECDYTNNISSQLIDYLPPQLDLQDQSITCEFQPVTFDAGSGFVSYMWQDGSSERTYTAWQPGTYWVTAKDSCGGIQSDTVQFIFDPATQLEIGFDSIEICLGDSVDISLSGFDAYQWTPGVAISCDTCSTVTLFPDSSMCYYVVANTEDGCYSMDTLCVVIKTDTVENEQYQLLCPGDSVSFNGEWISDAGTYELVVPNGNCFILNRLVVELSEVPGLSFTTTSPCPDEQNGSITAVATGGVPPYIYHWPGTQGPALDNIGSGNYSVTVTDAQGCKTVDSVWLENLPEPQIEFSVSAPLCQDDSTGILEILNPITGFLFGLTPQTLVTNHVFGNLPAGTRTLFFRDSVGCTWDTSFLVPEAVPFWIELPSDTSIYCGDSITLQVNSSSSISNYNWTPETGLSCSTCPEPVASNSQSQTYTLTAISTDGCVAIDSIQIEIDDEGRIYIPNAFTPNNDGINDIFYIFGDNIDKVLVFRVFDRWGGMVYKGENFPANDPAFGWDGKHQGKPAHIDVYAWYARLQLCNGSIVFKKGDVTLLR